MIVVIGGTKGGTGKSTIATNLAVISAKEGHETLLVETDPQENSACWVDVRTDLNVQPTINSVIKYGSSLKNDIKALSQKFQHIIVDSGGHDSDNFRSILVVADVLITPFKASSFDLWTTAKLDLTVSQAKIINERLRAYIILNEVSPNPKMEDAPAAANYLSAELENFETLDFNIKHRVIYKRVIGKGKSVVEMQPADDKANEEIMRLYRFIFNGQKD